MFDIHIGTSGFPLGSNAVMQRIKLTHRGLKAAGCNPLIISKHSLYKTQNSTRFGRYQGIPYLAMSYFLDRPDNIFIRLLNKYSGSLGEFYFLISKRKKIHSAIASGVTFFELVYYWLMSRILGFKLVIQHVEYVSAMQKKRNWWGRLNAHLYDYYRYHFCDGVIVISEYLKKHAQSCKPDLPLIKIPAICDFDEFNKPYVVQPKQYLMYCGSIGYLSVIEFIITLFTQLRDQKIYEGNLLFAIGVGDKTSAVYQLLLNAIKQNPYKDSIELLVNVPFDELVLKYREAELLIVPMRNEIQDIAGFHHKVGEYCAASKPIISTRYGEMDYYFRDGISAILAEEYTIESYVNKLSNVLNDKETLLKVAAEGHSVGLLNLEYRNNGMLLKEFIYNGL